MEPVEAKPHEAQQRLGDVAKRERLDDAPAHADGSDVRRWSAYAPSVICSLKG